MPVMATEAAVPDPRQGWGESGDTEPLVHWSSSALLLAAAAAGWASRATAGRLRPTVTAMAASPCSMRAWMKRRNTLDPLFLREAAAVGRAAVRTGTSAANLAGT